MATPTLTLEHHGQPITVTVDGAVVDEFGQAVPGAGVTLYVGGQALANSTSDERGQFELSKVKTSVAIHEISARKPGYAPVDEQLVLRKETDATTVTVGLRLDTAAEARPAPPYPGEDYGYSYLLKVETYARVTVFFATDRNSLISRAVQDPKKVFGSDRSPDGALSFGHCEVSIPAQHRVGKIEQPKFWKLEAETPSEHIVVLKLEKYAEADFIRNVIISSQDSGQAFVFVHGYYTTFPEAIRRTAQIAFDLDFRGAAICYSWPSKGRFLGYLADEAAVEWSTPHLCEFLAKLSSADAIKTIHLIAHSMGNRATLRCLEQPTASLNAHLQQVVLAAPDVDAGVFQQLGTKIVSASKRTTMYASSKDLPLRMSRYFHSYQRAGESGSNIVVVPNIDTVDVSALPSDILGHSEYGNSRTLLADIYELFRNGTPPPRFGLKKANSSKPFWVFVP